jgi:hypothetical protein
LDVSDDVTAMKAEDLVAYLHPRDQPDRDHTLAAAQQVRHLLAYLAATARPCTARRTYPQPDVTIAVATALRDGMRSAAELFDRLAKVHDRYAGNLRLHAADSDDAHPGVYYVEQSFLTLTGIADRCDELAADLDAAVRASGRFSIEADQ